MSQGIRFRGNPAQIMAWLIQPLLFLFALGSGLESLSAASTDGVDLNELPTWLGMLTRIDPLTYAVDAMRCT